MLTPDAPFYVKPLYDPGLWSWMLRFAAHCNARDWRAAMTPRAAILIESREQLARWVERHALQCAFAELGLDYAFPAQPQPATTALSDDSRVRNKRCRTFK